MTGPAPPWTGMPPTSSLPTLPERPGSAPSLAVQHPPGRESARRITGTAAITDGDVTSCSRAADLHACLLRTVPIGVATEGSFWAVAAHGRHYSL